MIYALSHGSPENASNDSRLGQALRKIRAQWQSTPRAIICISAHWESTGSFYNNTPEPQTLHDFYGFSDELSNMIQPMRTDTELATLFGQEFPEWKSTQRPADHGVWTITKHIDPQWDIPVLLLSLDRNKSLEKHWEDGMRIGTFAKKYNCVLIGSGAFTHNLRLLGQPIATMNVWYQSLRNAMIDKNIAALTHPKAEIPYFDLIHPSLEHFIPFVVCAGAGQNSVCRQCVDLWEYQNLSLAGFVWQ